MGITFGGGDTNKRALEYMEKKYGEKFEYIKPGGGGYLTNVRTILVSCESLPGKEIVLVILKDGKGERYKDNYKDNYFAGQVEDFVVNIAKKYFDDVTFEVSISRLSTYPEDDPMPTFEDYISNKYISGSMDINDTSEETMREFFDELMTMGLYFSIDIDIPSTGAGYYSAYYDDNTEYRFYRRH